MKWIIFVFGALLFSLHSVATQAQSGCHFSDRRKPLIFISLDDAKPVAEKKGGKKVKYKSLRLANNSSCEIHLSTNEDSSQNEYGTKVDYDIQAPKKSKLRPGNYTFMSDVRYLIKILPGNTLRFWVKENHIHKNVLLSLPYEYAWESNPDSKLGGTVEHRVYYIYQFPKGYIDY